MLQKYWWKILTICLLYYTVIAGLLMEAPRLNILNETIRNLHFHVPMWFGMMFLLIISVVNSIRYLQNPKIQTFIGSHSELWTKFQLKRPFSFD